MSHTPNLIALEEEIGEIRATDDLKDVLPTE